MCYCRYRDVLWPICMFRKANGAGSWRVFVKRKEPKPEIPDMWG